MVKEAERSLYPTNRRQGTQKEFVLQNPRVLLSFNSVKCPTVDLVTSCQNGAKRCLNGASPVGSVVKSPTVQGLQGMRVPSLSEDSPGGGHGNPLQRACLENPMDRGALRTTVHRIMKSRT